MHLFKQKGIVAILRKSKKLRQRSTCLEKIVYLVSAKNIVFAAQRASNKIKRDARNWAPLSHKAPQCGAFRGFETAV